MLSGTVALTATTGGGAVRVEFAVSPANAGTWTQIADDAVAPFGAPFDTAALADGLYDLRAIGFDGLGNASAASVREDVRLDNTAPELVSATPADGSVSATANQIVLTASEPVTAPGALLDGSAAPAPMVAGNDLTFPTGALADGLHVLAGELVDASGTRVPLPRRGHDRKHPVGRSAAGRAEHHRPRATDADGARRARHGSDAAERLAHAADAAGLHPRPPGRRRRTRRRCFAPGTQIVDVTARWALAGTYVTEFGAPIEIVISNPAGGPVIPATSPDGAPGGRSRRWRRAAQRDGFSRNGSDVHVWTRHLSYFGLMLDGEAPTEPRDLAGVVADDGLTLRWIPGTDASGQIGNVTLYVNGEPYREFGPTEFERSWARSPPATRAASRWRRRTRPATSAARRRRFGRCRCSPASRSPRRRALGAAWFTLGSVTETIEPTVPPGTVVEPAGIRLALASSPIDIVVARGVTAPQTRLAFSIAGSKRITLKKATTFAVRIKVSEAGAGDGHAPRREAAAAPHLEASRQGGRERRQSACGSRADPAARHVLADLGCAVGYGDDQPHDPADPGRAGARTGSAERGTDRRRARRRDRARRRPAAGRPGRPAASVAAGVDHAYSLLASAGQGVDLVVVDADAYGARLVSDLRAVFPRCG